MPSMKHTHKYYKRDNGTWACALPNCTHFLPKNVADSIQYAHSICWSCENKMELDERLIKIDKPVCWSCLENQSRSPILDGIDEFLRQREQPSALDRVKEIVK